MAEGILKHKSGDLIRVESAGSKPSGTVHPLAIRAMGEIGIDISGGRSKNLSEFLDCEVLEQGRVVKTWNPKRCLSSGRVTHAINQPTNERFRQIT
jgi:hypothetical protein